VSQGAEPLFGVGLSLLIQTQAYLEEIESKQRENMDLGW
jgi:hypothetical protein